MSWILQKPHGHRDTIVYKAVTLNGTKQFKVFETIVFLLTMIFPKYLQKLSYQLDAAWLV
jgi:hypothetical protein